MTRPTLHLCLSLLALSACGKSTSSADAGTGSAVCSLANCQTMIGQCDLDLLDDADFTWCASNTPRPDDGGTYPDETSSCVQVCQAADNAVLVQCLADHAMECKATASSPDTQQNTLVQCQAQQKAARNAIPSAHCDSQCQVTRAQCQGMCPVTDFASCYQCSLNCSLTALACRKQCPAEPAHCSNHQQDGNETAVDCGGDCGPCLENQPCAVDADCESQHCTGGTCAAIVACAKVGDCPGNACLNGTCR